MDPINLLISILTFAGAIPFIIATFGIIITQSSFYLFALIGYGAVIQSFISGMHWGISLEVERSVKTLLISIVFSLLSFLSILFYKIPSIALLIQLFSFNMLYLIDVYIVNEDAYPNQYIITRQIITGIVTAILIINLILINIITIN